MLILFRQLRHQKRLLSTWTDTFDKYLIGAEPAVKDQHSKLLAKRNLIYNIEIQDVKPGYVSEYLSNAEKVLPDIHADSDIPVELFGQFHVQLGQLDRVYTIWRHSDGYNAVDKTLLQLNQVKGYGKFLEEQGKLLRKREQQLCYEFAFWPQYDDYYDGGIFELRSYSLKAGCLYEWANAWSKAVNLREKDAVMGLCSQIGDMYTVHHIWRYTDLEHRKTERDMSWQSGEWADLVIKTVPMIKNLQVNIMQPSIYSPLR